MNGEHRFFVGEIGSQAAFSKRCPCKGVSMFAHAVGWSSSGMAAGQIVASAELSASERCECEFGYDWTVLHWKSSTRAARGNMSTR